MSTERPSRALTKKRKLPVSNFRASNNNVANRKSTIPEHNSHFLSVNSSETSGKENGRAAKKAKIYADSTLRSDVLLIIMKQNAEILGLMKEQSNMTRAILSSIRTASAYSNQVVSSKTLRTEPDLLRLVCMN